MTHTRMCQECPVSLEKLSFFYIQVKIIQVLVFDNWHPLNLNIYISCQAISLTAQYQERQLLLDILHCHDRNIDGFFVVYLYL